MTDPKQSWSEFAGLRVISGSVWVPRYGAPVADVSFASDAKLPPVAILKIGTLSLRMAVVRSGAFGGSRSARLIGGSGGWRRELEARAYASDAGVLSSMVLTDAAIETGETVVVAQPTYLGTSFVRLAGPASRLLTSLGGELWYVDAAGVTQVGTPRLATPITSDFTATQRHGGAGFVQVATEDEGSWLPGRSFASPLFPDVKTIAASRFAVAPSGRARLEVICA